MGYRFCKKCGWLKTDEYELDEYGNPICPKHQVRTRNFRDEEPNTYKRGHK